MDNSEPSNALGRGILPSYQSWKQFCGLSEKDRESVLKRLGLPIRTPLPARHFSDMSVRELLPLFDVIPGPLSHDRQRHGTPPQSVDEYDGSRTGSVNRDYASHRMPPTEVTVDLGWLICVPSYTALGAVRRFVPRNRMPCSFHIRHFCREGDRCSWSHDVAQLPFPPPALSSKALRQKRKRARALEEGTGWRLCGDVSVGRF